VRHIELACDMYCPMDATGKTICLNMIVRNEASVIRRCLSSVRSIVDYWVIVDTGSTDGTQDIIREHLRGLPGELHERPWKNFAHNRSEALKLARGKSDYTLIIDADDTLEISSDAALPPLTADSYAVDISDTATIYQRTQLVRSALPWRYEGVLHEYLTCEGAGPSGHLSGIRMIRNHDGARRKDPETYRRDAALLESALQTEINPLLISRYRFYLAQSYRDCGEKEKALEHYLARAKLEFWDQEVYVSLYEAAKLQDALGRPPDEVLATFRRAIQTCPARAEAYHGASRYLRDQKRFAEGYEIAKAGLDLQPAVGALFVNQWIYQHGLLDEYAVNAYWAGHYGDCLSACRRILASEGIPLEDRQRVQANANYASAKIREDEAARKQLSRQPGESYPMSTWAPDRAQGGTELMLEELRSRLSGALDSIDLKVNLFARDELTDKPLVVWIHHDVDQEVIQWCRDASLVSRVHTFVFVSYWQMERYIQKFGLPVAKCVILRNATSLGRPFRSWNPGNIRQIAYVSTPNRGLDVLLDAWAKLKPARAQLHIWSSLRLYGESDEQYAELFARANSLPEVFYRGIVPNDLLRNELRRIDYLAYPSTFAETSCLSVIEAMSSGCRVICPALGALPETAAGFARIYPWRPNPSAHAAAFSNILAEELDNPWEGRAHLSWAQQLYCHMFYDWAIRAEEWRTLLNRICSGR
jgi:glycosyltransferase involved in cell wall biosynthesis